MFFTRIPIPSAKVWNPESLQHAAAYFPLMGWIVGGVAAAVFLLRIIFLFPAFGEWVKYSCDIAGNWCVP